MREHITGTIYLQYMVPLKKYVLPLWPQTMAPSIFSKSSGRPNRVSGNGPNPPSLFGYTQYCFPVTQIHQH